MTKDEALSKIKEILLNFCDNDMFNYVCISVVASLLDYLLEIKSKNINRAFVLPADEFVRVKDWNNIADQIKYDLLEKKYLYPEKEHEANNEYERGVLAAISVIRHRVHCICDL